MLNTLIKHFNIIMIFSCMILFTAGCSSDGSYDVTKKSDEFETDYSSVYAETISFGGMENSAYQSELNMSIENDVSAAVNEFDTLADEASENLPDGVKAAFKITQEIKRNSDGFISFIETHYIYSGGAHGNISWFPRNIDVLSPTPHNLELKELFNDDGYRETINRMIDELVEKHPDKYNELWEKPEINDENENNFYITDNELVIYFPPYTLSYYAKGFVEFPIRLSEISGMLNDEYKRLVSEDE